MKNLMIASIMTLSLTAFAEGGKGHEAKGPIAEKINAACGTTDAEAAKCPAGEKVGTGLIKCLNAYRKGGGKLSAGCHEALKEGREAHKAKKADK